MEENMLKVKYNELLARYNKGAEYLAKNPEDDKALEEFNRISDELNNIIQAIPNMTDKEKTEGFDINIQDYTDAKQAIKEQHLAVGEHSATVEPRGVIVKQEPVQSNPLPSFADNWKIANELAKSDIVPDNFKGKPANIVIAISLANRMNLDAFTVMQNMSVIHGKVTFSGSFARTLIERSGKFKNLELNYIGNENDDSYGAYLSATRISDGKVVKGPTVTLEMAKKEGWTKNPKWSSLKEIMLAYRCQSYFCRVHCPETMSGIYTTEEIEDINTTREQPKDIL